MLARFLPSKRILPLAGTCTPPSRPSRVVLPLPDGPLRNTRSPGCRVKRSISSSVGRSGHAKMTLSRWITGVGMGFLVRGLQFYVIAAGAQFTAILAARRDGLQQQLGAAGE